MDYFLTIKNIKKIIVGTTFLFGFFLSSSLSVFAATVQLSADTGGQVSIAGAGMSTYVIYGAASGTRAFIQAVPNDGKTFSGWEDGFTSYSSTLNPIITSNVTANALFENSPSAIMSINNQCVERIITFTNTSARAEGQSAISGLSKAQIYVLEGSSDAIAPQDATGYLFSSPNQSFYYAFNAATVGAGVYLGSNSAFRGRTSYLSLGSATVTSDVRYNCAGSPVSRYTVTLSSNLPATVSSTVTFTGAGTYNNHSIVTISAPNVPNYSFLGWSGYCGNTGYLFTNTTVKTSYPHTISNLESDCSFEAQYRYAPVTTTGLIKVSLAADPHGTVTLNGNTGYSVTEYVPYASTITVSANPDSGYQFSSWSDNFFGQSASFTYQVTGTVNVLASFIASTTVAGTGQCGNFAPDVRFYSNREGAGFMLVGAGNQTLSTTGSGLTYFTEPGNGYTYNCINWQVPTPTSNYGYSFVGWVGNLATSTLEVLNNTGYLYTSDLNGIESPTLTALFELNGNPNGTTVGNVLVRPIATSQTAVFNSNLSDYSTRFTNPNGVFPQTPYYIDGRCVVKVAKFQAREVGLFSSIFQSFAGADHIYTLYALEGSDLSVNLETSGIYSGVYTFKSDPSEFYMAVDGGTLADGNYNGSDSVFSAHQQSFDFVNVLPLENPKDYSCAPTVGQSVSTLVNTNIYSFDNPIVGHTYSTMSGPNLVTVYGTGTTFIPSDGSDSDSSVHFYDHILTKETYQRVFCSAGNSGVRLGVYCAMPVATTTFNNSTGFKASYFDYRYLWLFSSHPMKGFYHQEVSNWADVLADGVVEESEKIYGIQYFPADRVVPVQVGSTTISYSQITDAYLSSESFSCADDEPSCVSANDLNLYATRIDLTKCRFYEDVIAFRSSSSYDSCALSLNSNGGVVPSGFYGTAFNNATLNNRTNPTQLNGFLVDKAVDYADDVLFYRGFLTSNSAINFSEAENIPKLFSSKLFSRTFDTVRYNKVKSNIFTSVATTTIFVATSTTPSYTETINGYWISTSTTLTFGTTTSVGTTTITKICGYYASNSTQSCSYNSLVVANTNAAYRSAFSVAMPSFASTTSSVESLVLTLSSSTDGGGCNSGGCSSLDLILYSSSVNSGLTWSNAPSHTVITSATPASNKVIFTVPNGTFSPNTTYYLGLKYTTESGSKDGYFNNPNNSTLSYKYVANGYTVSTTTDTYIATSTVFHATSTVNSYYTTATNTSFFLGNVPISTSTPNGLFYFSPESYSASIGLEGYSSISKYTASLFAQYDVNDPVYGCYKAEYSVARSIGCALRAVVGSLFLTVFLPDEKQLKIMNDGLNNMIVDGGIISSILSMPLRSSSYSNLAWKPSTTTPLTIGFNSVDKVTVSVGSNAAAPFAKTDKLLSDYLYPFLLVGLFLLVGMSSVKLFS